MRPEHVESPRNRIAPDTLQVMYTHKSGDWSLARMTYDGIPNRMGCRWNGDLNDFESKGNPRSHGHGTWFILPDDVADLMWAVIVMGGGRHPEYPVPSDDRGSASPQPQLATG